MRRFQALTAIVVATFALAACGSGAQTAADPPAEAPTIRGPHPGG